MARNRPATGLPIGQSAASTSAGARFLRWSASRAARPRATPRANGSRLVKSSVPVADAEPDRAPARAPLAEPATGQGLEQGGGGDGGGGERQSRCEQPGEGRREDAVGRGVVAAVPLSVPEGEALAAEEVGPEGVRGQVDGPRLPDQIDAARNSEASTGASRHQSTRRHHGSRASGSGRSRMSRGTGAPSGGRVRGGAVTEENTARNTVDRLAHPSPSSGASSPRPDQPVDARLACARSSRGDRATSSGRPRPARARPHHRVRPRTPGRIPRRCRGRRAPHRISAGQRRSPSRSPARASTLGRRRAVELEDRPLGAVVEVLQHAIDELPGQPPGGWWPPSTPA